MNEEVYMEYNFFYYLPVSIFDIVCNYPQTLPANSNSSIKNLGNGFH